jgi:hypothetical protein
MSSSTKYFGGRGPCPQNLWAVARSGVTVSARDSRSSQTSERWCEGRGRSPVNVSRSSILPSSTKVRRWRSEIGSYAPWGPSAPPNWTTSRFKRGAPRRSATSWRTLCTSCDMCDDRMSRCTSAGKLGASSVSANATFSSVSARSVSERPPRKPCERKCGHWIPRAESRMRWSFSICGSGWYIIEALVGRSGMRAGMSMQSRRAFRTCHASSGPAYLSSSSLTREEKPSPHIPSGMPFARMMHSPGHSGAPQCRVDQRLGVLSATERSRRHTRMSRVQPRSRSSHGVCSRPPHCEKCRTRAASSGGSRTNADVWTFRRAFMSTARSFRARARLPPHMHATLPRWQPAVCRAHPRPLRGATSRSEKGRMDDTRVHPQTCFPRPHINSRRACGSLHLIKARG